jgi:hypothetical protein
MFGFNAPIEINDRLLPESGNMRGPTDQAVDFRINGDTVYPPNTRIIVPITDIGPEVPLNNSHNVDAQHLDLQGNDQPNGAYRPNSTGLVRRYESLALPNSKSLIRHSMSGPAKTMIPEMPATLGRISQVRCAADSSDT